MKKKHITIHRALVLLAALAAVSVFSFVADRGAEANTGDTDLIHARAAVVVNASTGKILYAKNSNTKLQPASTTKLITAMVVLDKLSPDEIVTVSRTAASTPSVKPRIRPGEKFTVRDLLNLALIRSVNSATVALAEAAAGSEEEFVELMNAKVRAIGAENTEFINASGLPGEGQQITAYDLTIIMKEALRYPLIREIVNTKDDKIYTEKGRKLPVRNTNHMLWNDEDVVGGKTGFTRSAGHCLVFAVQKGDAVIITSILGESRRGYIWNDSNTLLQIGEDVLASRREPEMYYTADAEDPIKVVTVKKRKRYRSGAVASKVKNSGSASSKASKKRQRSKSKESVASSGQKKPLKGVS